MECGFLKSSISTIARFAIVLLEDSAQALSGP
jgi:hypothetical protein